MSVLTAVIVKSTTAEVCSL